MNRRFGRLKRGAALATTVAIGLTPALVAAPAAHAAAPVPVTRIAGANRFGTAAAVAEKAFPSGASTVIVATGFNFPDALAGNYLAGLDKAPILLVNIDNVPTETQTALQTLKAKNVVILGQTDAVDANTEAQLKSEGYTTSRIGGATRYDTMQMINEAPNATTIGTINGKKTALLARGDNFPDALGGGPVAYAKNFPVILTATTALSPQAQDVITKDGIQQVIILGGTIAVPTAVEQQANAAGAATLYRANGKDRSDTSRLLAEYAISNLGFTTASYAIASGDQYFTGADALASGPFSGGIPQPTLITNSVNDPGTLVQFGQAHNATATNCYAIGGPIPLPDSTVNAVCNATPNGSAAPTNLPQLVSASILKTVTSTTATSTNPVGTYVQYVFSQAIGNDIINPQGFHVYDSAGDRYNGAGCGAGATNCSATVDSSNPNAVDVIFNQTAPNAVATTGGSATNNLQTTGAANLTLATVGGPQDSGGAALTSPNGASPDGSAPIGTAATTTANGAGVTSAPNAESWAITNTAGSNPATYPTGTPINVTFDKAAFVQSAAATYPGGAAGASSTGFDVVYTTQSGATAVGNGTTGEEACYGPATTDTTTASGGTVPGGNGTTTITIVCPDPAGGSTPIAAGSIARVIVQQNAVGTANPATGGPLTGGASGPNAAGTNIGSPLQAADTPRAPAASPSLTSVTFIPGSSSGTADTVVYTFDQALTSTPTASGFGWYLANGTQVTCGTAPAANCNAARNPNNFDQIIVTVGTGGTAAAPTGNNATLGAVGGNVKLGSVTAANTGLTNADDELGAANPNNSGSTVTPGTVNAPQLQSVHVATNTGITGTSYSATYTFTQPSSGGTTATPATTLTAAQANGLHLYDADGTELTCTAAATGSTTATANQVTCTSFTQVANTSANPPAAGTAATGAQQTSAVFGTADYGTVFGSTANSAPANNTNPEGGVATS
mgnify:CR=1 FL=1